MSSDPYVDAYFQFLATKDENFLAKYLVEISKDRALFGSLCVQTEETKYYVGSFLMELAEIPLGPVALYSCLNEYKNFLRHNIERENPDRIFELFISAERDFWDDGLQSVLSVVDVYSILREKFPSAITDISIKKDFHRRSFYELKKNLNDEGWKIFMHYCFCVIMLKKQEQIEQEKLTNERVQLHFVKKESINTKPVGLFIRLLSWFKKFFSSYKKKE